MNLLPNDFLQLSDTEARWRVLRCMAGLIVADDPSLNIVLAEIELANRGIHLYESDLDWFWSAEFCDELNLLRAVSGLDTALQMSEIADLQSKGSTKPLTIVSILVILGAVHLELRGKHAHHEGPSGSDDTIEIVLSADLSSGKTAAKDRIVKVPRSIMPPLKHRLGHLESARLPQRALEADAILAHPLSGPGMATPPGGDIGDRPAAGSPAGDLQ